MKKFYLASVFVLVCFFGRAQSQPFITTWEVTAGDLDIEIPTTGTGYNYTIDFGDGTVQNNVTGNISHTYSVPGTYTVSISGTFPRICFGCSSNLSIFDKILTIEQWGNIQWQSMESAFEGCVYLSIFAFDSPDLSQVTDMSNMFKDTDDYLLQPINNWDVSNVTDMSGMFQGNDKFNQSLDNWDVSNVTDMSNMFSGTAFNQPINNWDVSNVTNMSGMFQGVFYFDQPLGNWDVSNVTDMSNMFKGTSFNQPIGNWNVANITNMSGMFMETNSFNQPLNNWNVSNVTNMSSMFETTHTSDSFDQPINNWDVSNVTDMSNMFANSTFNQPLNNWDVSNVTNMSGMFGGFLGADFNQPINNWDVSNVTNMSGMFSSSFNQPINNWDVSNVTNMSAMFGRTNSFNQPLSNWDVSNVTDMSYMFVDAESFDQPLNNWDVSNVTNMSHMFGTYFDDTNIYNQPLNNWDVSNVTDMSSMFSGTANFNQSIENWDVSSVTDMSSMFARTIAFDQPLNNWDVSNVTDMRGMFAEASVFNQPLDNWNVSSVTNMKYMFRDTPIFNQPLNTWNVSNVTFMDGMFENASSFNQDISSWNFNPSSTVLFSDFLSYSGLDVNNYDAFLSQIASLDLDENVLDADGLKYCNILARNELTNNQGWYISGDNLSPNCNLISGFVPYDENANGCDPNDIGTDGIMVNIDDGTYNFSTFTNNGNYSTGVAGNTFTVSVTNLPPYYTATPASASVNFTSSNSAQQDFCLTATQSIEDLNISLLPVSEARPGFEADYQLVIKNVGTQSVANATATLTFDDTMQSFVSSTPAPTSSTANQLTFDLANLQPFETRTVDIVMQTFTPPTVNGGDVLDFTATIAPNTNDNTPTDNTFVFAQTVVNSFDPNDKQVLQGETISISQADEYLDYLIRFQNTGTASAINVRILDTLHPKLDYSTIQPVSASHTYHVEITDGNHVEFIFENINLPHEAADEPGSHGFVAYKIKPKSNVQIGDFITGDARIYFDFNAPIITNMVSTEIVNLGIDEHPNLANQIILYPNPAGDELKIHLTNGIVLEGVKIYNIQGRELQSFQGNRKSFNVSNLESGMYFMKIETNRGTVNRRLIKE